MFVLLWIKMGHIGKIDHFAKFKKESGTVHSKQKHEQETPAQARKRRGRGGRQ